MEIAMRVGNKSDGGKRKYPTHHIYTRKAHTHTHKNNIWTNCFLEFNTQITVFFCVYVKKKKKKTPQPLHPAAFVTTRPPVGGFDLQ